MNIIRHIPFLKKVLQFSFTAFGGPQGHLVMMKKIFVDQRKDITNEELLDFNAFTQLLPGPSSSQTVMLIGMKRGGVLLAIFTMLIWILPACIIMSFMSVLIYYLNLNHINTVSIFYYLNAMGIGFIAFAALLYSKEYLKNKATYIIALLSIPIVVFFINPWVFPLLIIAGGIVTNLSNKRLPDVDNHKRKKIHWNFALMFLGCFILLAVLSTLSILHDWQYSRLFNLSENFYRFGAITFGGGQILLPMMLYQFVSRPKSLGMAPLISSSQLMTGYGIVNSIPGPVFSISAFVGGMVMAGHGIVVQIFAGLLSGIFVFLPGFLLIVFLFPIYHNLKYHIIIFRALEGIKAVITGILWASLFIVWRNSIHEKLIINFIVALGTFLVLKYTKFPPPLIAIVVIALGFLLFIL